MRTPPHRHGADGSCEAGPCRARPGRFATYFLMLMTVSSVVRPNSDVRTRMPAVPPPRSALFGIRVVKDAFPELPLAAYNVSGEYSMVKAAAKEGWIDEERVVLETMISFRRAGADLIITYHAKDVARWLSKK